MLDLQLLWLFLLRLDREDIIIFLLLFNLMIEEKVPDEVHLEKRIGDEDIPTL